MTKPETPAEEAVARIIEAYLASQMQPEQFGLWLGRIAKDFANGELGRPKEVN